MRHSDSVKDIFDFAMDGAAERPPRVSVPVRREFVFDDERPMSVGGSVGSGDDPRATAPAVEAPLFDAREGRSSLNSGCFPSPSNSSPAFGLGSDLHVTGAKYGTGRAPCDSGLSRRKSESAVALLRAARAITDMGAATNPRTRRRTDAVHLRPLPVSASTSGMTGSPTASSHARGSRVSQGSAPEVSASANHVTETDLGTSPASSSFKTSPLRGPGARVGSPRHRDVLRVAAADMFRGFPGGPTAPLRMDADLSPRAGAGGPGAGAGAPSGGLDAGTEHAGRAAVVLDPISTRPNGTRLRRSMTVSHYQYQLRRRGGGNVRTGEARRVITPTGRLLPPGSSLPRLRALHVMPRQVCRLVDEEASAAVRAVLEWHPDTDRALTKRPLSATHRAPPAANARARTTSLDLHRPPTPSPLSPCRRRRAISFDDRYDRDAHVVVPAAVVRSTSIREAGSGGSGLGDGEAGSVGGSPGSGGSTGEGGAVAALPPALAATVDKA